MGGYDLLQGDPLQNYEDPGFRYPIFEAQIKTEDGRNFLVNGISVTGKNISLDFRFILI